MKKQEIELLISDWQDSYRKANGREPEEMTYINGWFYLGGPYGWKYRAAKLREMTENLKSRIN